MMRSLLQRTALLFAGVLGLLGTRPATANAQKALVYCPITIDATGCNAVVTALTGPAYPLGVDRGYDGTGGTVDLTTVDLFTYSVFVVPSLADGTTSQPYAKLRDPEVVEHLKAALIGRLAMWSGSPDQGATNRAMKDALIQNLAGWAGGAFATAKGPGLVALLDASASTATRYDWVRAITPVPVVSDPTLLIYSAVRALDPRATAILTSGAGPIAYDNMATFGFQVPNGAAGVSLDAVGQTGTTQGGQVVLLTMEAGNASGALVKTDRDDYAPGETVTITGTGWQPGETVKLSLHMDPLRDSDTELTATADANGNITNTDFAPAEYDLRVRFVLTAIGQASGRRAQTTFTDSRAINSATLNGAATVTVSPGESIAASVNATTDNAGGNNDWESTSWRIATTPPPPGTCENTGDHTSSGTFTEVFSITAPAVPGTYNAYFTAHTGQTCATSQQSAVFSLVNAVVVVGAPTITTISPTTKMYGDAAFTLTVNGTNFAQSSVVRFNGSNRVTTFVNTTQLTAAITAADLLSAGNFPVSVRNSDNTVSNSVDFTVAPRPITVTADAKTKVYGNTDPALTYGITSGSLVGSDAFSGALTRDAGENVGTYAIKQGTLALSANYDLTFVGANLSITARPLTVTADATSKVYGDSDPAFTYVVSGGPLVGSDAVTGTLTRTAGENVGTYAILQGSVTAGANYAITYVGANLTITTRALTVTADPATKVYGDADPAFTYQLTSGALVTGDAFSGALSRASGENVGTYALQLGTLTAGTNYTITFVPANLTISARPITVTADGKTKVYGNSDPALTYQVTTGSLAFSDAFTGTVARAAGEAVGTYAITQGTLSAGPNYNLAFIGANLTVTARPITVTADAKSKIYGDADPALTYQITSGSLAFSDAITGALTRVAGEDVGAYAIQQGTLALGTNYDLTFTGASLTINKRPITVTADPKSKVYGDADPALTYQLTLGNLIGTDALTGALTRAAGETVGTYAIQQGTLTAGGNYDLTFVTANLTITARPITVTADAKTKVYGAPDPSFTYQVTTGSLVSGDSFSGSLGRAAGENVGTYGITQGTLTAGANYNLSFVGADLTITVRPVTVTADAKNKVYGNADPALTYQITTGSLAFTDAFSGALARAAGENVGTYAISQGTLALDANYNLSFVGADLTITARPVTVTADAKTKVYGDADPALTYQITSGSLAFSDAFTGTLTRVAGEAVGAYAIQQGTLALTPNYTLTYVGANLTITARPITVTADAKSKVYGDVDPAFTYQLTSGTLVSGDAITGSLTRVAGEAVGTYAIQQGTLTAGTNYDLTFVPANLTITQRPITVTADAKSKVYGDADPALTYQITSGNLAFGDTFSGALARAAGESVGTYAINQGTLAAGPNYALTYAGANLTITTRPVTVSADPKTKVYGDADPTLTYQITTGSLAFSDAFSGALTRAPGTIVGTYAIQQGTLALNANYVLSYVGANFTITARPITVTADAKSKTYGEADPALTYQLTSGTLVDEGDLTGTLTRAPGENVGSYAITQGSVAATTNYTLTFVGANLTIDKRPITIAADAKTKVYGNADPAFTYQITSGNLVFTDAFTGALTRAAGENVGTYAILQGGVTAGDNYDVTFVGADLTITQRPITVTANAQTKIYGDADPALTYAVTTGSLAFSDAFSGALARAAGANVGTYAISQGTLTAGGNYVLSFVGANLTITPRALIVTADAKSKIAGAVNPTLTGTIVGVQFADGITATFATTAATLSLPGSYPITAGTNDPNTKLGNYTVTLNHATLTVTDNAKPVLGAFTGPVLPVPLGTAINLSIPFTDADVAASQPYTATIDWGNGTTSTSTFASPGTISDTKNYPVVGVYIVKVTVKQDNFPTTHYDTKTYEYYVVVYDPNAGFVTGGGWIDSPAGAYAADPSLKGKATFGFVSKYKKGQTTPDGSTEFQFHAAGMNFKSTVYEWLVVAGAKAQFKGSGTINGAGNYGFILTAIDGQISGGGGADKFRIKIWDKNNGDAVVYDNQMLVPDTADPTTLLGGGSINIQAK